MLKIFRRWLRRPSAQTQGGPADDPSVSRAGMMTRGARAGDQRHRPTRAEADLAEKLGTTAYDPERRL